MSKVYKQRAIVLISEESGERKDFKSINAAAAFLRTTFGNVQRSALYNGTMNGWRLFESPESIRKHIADLEEQLRILEG